MKKFLVFTIIVILLTAALSLIQGRTKNSSLIPSPSKNSSESQPRERIKIVARDLNIPWELVFLPNNDMLFTERLGNLKMISNDRVSTVSKIPDVKVYGEGGLLGLALSPNFPANHYIFLYYTFSGKNNQTLNRVVRYKFENNSLSDQKILVDNIPGEIYHNGGRIKFGPDNFLYVTTGDSREPSLAQNKNSLAGKILRVDEDGKAAPDNPFKNLVYSYGHRNPQGLGWDKDGRLWSTEHGPSGELGLCCRDEVNIIIKGKNYGWPEVTGDQKKSGLEAPFIQSGNDTWAPAGVTFLDDNFFFGGLKGEALYKLQTNGGVAQISPLLKNEVGRIRDVVLGPDGFFYILTSNRDGRGTIRTGDDQILKVDPNQI